MRAAVSGSSSCAAQQPAVRRRLRLGLVVLAVSVGLVSARAGCCFIWCGQ